MTGRPSSGRAAAHRELNLELARLVLDGRGTTWAEQVAVEADQVIGTRTPVSAANRPASRRAHPPQARAAVRWAVPCSGCDGWTAARPGRPVLEPLCPPCLAARRRAARDQQKPRTKPAGTGWANSPRLRLTDAERRGRGRDDFPRPARREPLDRLSP